MTLHEVVLTLHSYLRWVVVIAGLTVVVRAVAGARAGRKWDVKDGKLLFAFLRAVDLQILLGLFMYFATSALGIRMATHAGEAMKSSVLRFFLVEHMFGMLIAVAVLHIGTARLAKRGDDPGRHRGTAIVVGIGYAILLASVPWPFFPYGRPLFHGL